VLFRSNTNETDDLLRGEKVTAALSDERMQSLKMGMAISFPVQRSNWVS
jgi:hypothetical protein